MDEWRNNHFAVILMWDYRLCYHRGVAGKHAQHGASSPFPASDFITAVMVPPPPSKVDPIIVQQYKPIGCFQDNHVHLSLQ